MPKMPQMDLIAELKKRQVKPQVREGKDGVLEDIITGRNRSCLGGLAAGAKRKLCAHECEKNQQLSKSLLFYPAFRSEEHAVQEDRWSTASTAPGHLSSCEEENPPQAHVQETGFQNTLYIELHERTVSRTTQCVFKTNNVNLL